MSFYNFKNEDNKVAMAMDLKNEKMNTDKVFKIGDKVIYKPLMKGLPKDSVGIVSKVNGDFISVSYPQYAPVEENGKYKYSNYVYAHSANTKDLKLVEKPTNSYKISNKSQ